MSLGTQKYQKKECQRLIKPVSSGRTFFRYSKK